MQRVLRMKKAIEVIEQIKMTNLLRTRTWLRVAGAGLILLTATSCKDGPNDTKWQFLPDMADAPTVKAQESYIDPPEGSQTTDAILYPDDIMDAQEVLVNPLGRYSGVLLERQVDQGKKLFGIFCQHCHGADGKGQGSITDVFVPAPDITQEPYISERKDGFFFHKITFGGALMPRLGHAISPDERWKIVLYIRELQNKGETK